MLGGFYQKVIKSIMELLTWTNAVALLAFGLLCLGLSKKKKTGLSIFFGFLVLAFTVIKGCQDGRANTLSVLKQDTIKVDLDTIRAKTFKIDTLTVEIDTLNSYVKKVEAMGLRRDSIRNLPVPVNQTFNTRIGSVKSKDFTIGTKN